MPIEELLVRYCTMVWHKGFRALRRDFTRDAIIDYTDAGGIRGTLPEIKAWLTTALVPFVMVQHHVTNFEIRIEGDRARSACYLFDPMGLGSPGRDTTLFWCGGRYRDELIRTSNGWRIESRVNELLYMHGAPATWGRKAEAHNFVEAPLSGGRFLRATSFLRLCGAGI